MLILARCALIVAVVIAPWLNAGADLLVRPYLYGAVACCWGLMCLGLVVRPQHPRLPTVIAPLLLAAAMAVLHLAPLYTLDATAAPSAATELRAKLTPGDALVSSATRFSHSLDPGNARTQLASLIVAIAALLAAYRLLDSRRWLEWTLGCLAMNAVAVTFFAVFQRYTWNGRLYWLFELPRNHTTFGPFVYHNAAGIFLAMSLPAAVYFLGYPDRSQSQRLLGRSPTTMARVQSWLSRLTGVDLLVFFAVVLVLSGLLCSLSRGAVVAACGASLVVWLWTSLQSRRSVGLGAMGVCAMVALALIAWVGMDQAVAQRLGTLGDAESLWQREDRLSMWRDALPMARDFLWLGAGLGSFRLLNAAYQSWEHPSWWTHAHNQYLEALLDGGVLGLALLLACCTLVFAAGFYALRGAERRPRALAALALCALLAAAIHGLFDYCLYLPSTYLLAALYCGIVYRAAEANRPAPRWVTLPVSPAAVWCLHLLVAVGLGWSVLQAAAAARTDRALRAIPWNREQASLRIDDVDESIANLTASLAHDNGVLAREALVELWLTRYRLQAATTLSAELNVPRDDPNVWDWTLPIVLHHRVHDLMKAGRSRDVEELRNQPAVRENLIPALQHVLAGLRVSPLLPGLHLHLEELEFLLPNPHYDGRHASRAARLAPWDPETLFACGRLHFSADRREAAYAAWKACLTASPRLRDNVVRLAAQHLSTEELAARVLPASPELLIDLAETTYAASDEDRELLLTRADGLTPAEAVSPAQQRWLTARIHELRNEPEPAIEELRAAIRLEPRNLPWRRSLVRMLIAVNRVQEAEREAWVCTRLAPRDVGNQSLLARARRLNQTRKNVVVTSKLAPEK